MRVQYIFGVDPGGEHQAHTVDSQRGTGWCLFEVRDDAPAILESHGHVLGGPNTWVRAMTDSDHPAHRALRLSTRAVVEGFRLFNIKASADPLETIGMMKLWSVINGKELKVSRPGQRTGVSHDDLKRMGMWPGGRGHADTAQAIRHVLSAIMAEGHQPTIELFAQFHEPESVEEPVAPPSKPMTWADLNP